MSQKETICIFVNPISGRGWGARVAEVVGDRLELEGYCVQTFIARDGWEGMCEDCAAAVVIGGDGTLRMVAGRLLERFGDKVPPLLPVAGGTANLMVRHLGMLWKPGKVAENLVQTLWSRRMVHLDIARANGKLFLLMAGVGFDAAVVHELDRLRTGPINHLSYIWPALRAMHGCTFPPVRLSVDGKAVGEDRPGMVMVANVPEYGTGFPILPHARSDDGLLDVCRLPCTTRVGLIRWMTSAARGKHLRRQGVDCVRGKLIRIESDRPVPVQVDGEAFGFTPLEIDLLPVKLRFIVPAKE